jgi:restriction system protein
MAVPDYETLMLPVLKYLSDGQVRKTAQLVSFIAERFHLSPEDRKQLIPSGRAKLINNRVGWACTYLRKAGLISSPRRAYNQITDDGTGVLASHPQKIDITFLQQFPKFRQFQEDSKAIEKQEAKASATLTEQTPEEIIGAQSELINSSLAADLLEQITTMSPDAFEQLVVDLLLAMGYGGTAEDAGRAIGKSNDGGIDGVIMEDVLGLDTIYIQAKKWKGTVPVKEVRDFAGALMSKRSGKGVFITTSNFPPSADEFVKSVGLKIILIDGKRLASLMIKYNLGVTTTSTIEIKQIDSDYFAN